MRLLPTRRLPGSGLLVTRVALGPEGEAPRAEVEATLLERWRLQPYVDSVEGCSLGSAWGCSLHNT